MRSREASRPFSITRSNGTLNEPGMWPERRPGPRLRRLAAEPLGRARIDDLHAAVCERHAHVGQHGDGVDVHFGIECLRRSLGLAALDRPAFRLPFRQAAIEDVDFLRAEDAERPPHARRRVEADAVIDHDRIAIADAERADDFAELRGPRQHVRQVGGMIADRLDVEEHRAGNMAAAILGLRIALLRRHEVRAVDGDDVADRADARRANRSRPASGWSATGQGRFRVSAFWFSIQFDNATTTRAALREVHS